jgi:photosystem II stability/assembly factor-like uncharacterized protein
MSKPIVRLATAAPALLSILMSMGGSRYVEARTLTWTTTGPQGGSVVTALANDADRRILYVGTAGGGVFRSNNDGRTWGAASEGLASRQIRALAIDPQTPSTLYAGTSGAGVFKSTDAGDSWKACGGKFLFGANELSFVTTLAVDPGNPATLYAGTAHFWSPDHLIGGAVYKSVDGGETWTWSIALFEAVHVAVDPRTPTTVYASGWGGWYSPWNESFRKSILHKSTDGGRTWLSLRSGIPPFDPRDLPYAPPVRSLAFDPHDATTLYACGGYGVFKTTADSGIWSKVSAGLPTSPSFRGYASCGAIAIDPAHPATLYAYIHSSGLFKSTDAGGSWVQSGSDTDIQDVFVLTFDPSNRDALYAGGVHGFSITRDGGEEWRDATDGIVNSHIVALAADPGRPGVVYAGGTWAAQGFGDPGVGVFKSLDQGRHWKPVSTGLTNRYVQSLAIDPQTPTTLYALTWGGLFKSTDAGDSWRETGWEYGGVAVVVDPRSSATVYLGHDGGGVQRSDDGGANWVAVNEGLGVETKYVTALLFDPGDPATLYVATGSGEVFKSANRGARWQRLGLAHRGFQVLAIDPRTPSTLYSGWCAWNLDGTYDCGVLRSDNGGFGWKAVNVGLGSTAGRRIFSLAVDPRAPSIVYAGTEGGIFVSADRGETWNPFNSGITGLPVEALLIDSQGPGAIYAGTRLGGVFVYSPGRPVAGGGAGGR